MQKHLPLISIVVLITALISYAILYHRISSEYRVLKLFTEQQQDSLKYYRLEALGDSLLFTENDSLALFAFQQADSLFHHSILTNRAHQFINNRDSLRRIKEDEFATLRQKMLFALRSLLSREEDVNSRDNQLRDMNQELLRFQKELSTLNKELEEKARSIGKLEFKTTHGSSVYYVGDIKEGKANGYGSGSFSTGSIYVGMWKDNRRHGTGRYTWKDGSIYDGNYLNDSRNGIGTYFFTSGEKYVGEWVNDKREGTGVLYDKDGKVLLNGLWKNDEYVR